MLSRTYNGAFLSCDFCVAHETKVTLQVEWCQLCLSCDVCVSLLPLHRTACPPGRFTWRKQCRSYTMLRPLQQRIRAHGVWGRCLYMKLLTHTTSWDTRSQHISLCPPLILTSHVGPVVPFCQFRVLDRRNLLWVPTAHGLPQLWYFLLISDRIFPVTATMCDPNSRLVTSIVIFFCYIHEVFLLQSSLPLWHLLVFAEKHPLISFSSRGNF